MRSRRTLIALTCAIATLACSAVTAGPALAAGNAALNDCQANGKLTHSYTLAELRHAQAVMPASVKEYSNCSDVINQAILAAVGKGSKTAGGSGSSSGGSFLPTPVIIILVVLVLAGVTFGAIAIRGRRQDGGPSGPGARGPGGRGPGDPGGGGPADSPGGGAAA